MNISDVLRKKITDKLQGDPKVMTFALAKELGVPEQAVMECLPKDEVVRVEAEHFNEIMDSIATWGKVTTIVQTEYVVLEAKGLLPKGSYGHGYFNLVGNSNNTGGHIRSDLISAIYFVTRPFMGLLSMSVQFFSLSGAPMFKVYLGRDEKKMLLPEQVENFNVLRDRLAESA